MSYTKWFDAHATKHKKIVERLLEQGYTDRDIVDYFDFDNMVINEVEFCPLYKDNKKCHDMDDLNCYLCACVNFRFNDEGLSNSNNLKILSRCDINNGEKFVGEDFIHQDCSTCSVPHDREYVIKNFSLVWGEMMKNCKVIIKK
ncbi:MAG: hypothetical protein U9N33_02575 [Campylobacterota bacterium]|nr:hypothetical protein [Campylobacterota bacterium]